MIEFKERISHLQGEVDHLKVSPAPQEEATEAVSSLFEILQTDEEGEFDDFCIGLTEERKRKQRLYENSTAAIRWPSGPRPETLQVFAKRWKCTWSGGSPMLKLAQLKLRRLLVKNLPLELN
ncbi:hypothetical protein CAPTEDRAFT_205494 [Capitella teleta]|uniref:Uncharacterized protein n=1 Tax=Capitella teleta TaxID=283909 RepID=R7TA54_CAPTE|nr:hypothetical protein CAPTEDRAFT_205494 [Capitella teleta]|eukprot:ELT88265.1 hypothetical protein CAPTEDRAFT_205494 [Capitella teleta]